MTPYQEVIFKRTYARWLEHEGRRENWHEAVNRYHDFFIPRVPTNLMGEYHNAIDAFVQQHIMGSMRCLWTAGPALARENICGFNCAYLSMRDIRAFAELLYILMCGTGCGVSVERQEINQLPLVPPLCQQDDRLLVFDDSKEGWAKGYLKLLQYLYTGAIPRIDLSVIRPKGARLQTFGGRASGPEPLRQLIDFTVSIFKGAVGRRLYSDEVSDLACMIASCVVVGGVRRSAILLLTNPSDRRMQGYKSGQFWETKPYRSYANVSACYTEQPDAKTFMGDFLRLVESGTGEPGIVNRLALQGSRGDYTQAFGVNPCGEVILRDMEFCNLSEVVCRPNDSFRDLQAKVVHATILGVLQSTLTEYNFVRSGWKENVREERLLGVSLTGIMDCHTVLAHLGKLRQAAQETATKWAKALGIPIPAAITCVKPSGTVSQLVDSASGMHPRYAEQYIRRVRVAAADPIAHFLYEEGVPCKPEVGQEIGNANTLVFEFPIESPVTSITRDRMSALRQLNIWLRLKEQWTDHNPSCTIYVKDFEWPDVSAWVYQNWQKIGGITFLPYDTGIYQLAPYEEISPEEFKRLSDSFPTLSWDKLSRYETDDCTTGSHEYACAGGACEL